MLRPMGKGRTTLMLSRRSCPSTVALRRELFPSLAQWMSRTLHREVARLFSQIFASEQACSYYSREFPFGDFVNFVDFILWPMNTIYRILKNRPCEDLCKESHNIPWKLMALSHLTPWVVIRNVIGTLAPLSSVAVTVIRDSASISADHKCL